MSKSDSESESELELFCITPPLLPHFSIWYAPMYAIYPVGETDDNKPSTSIDISDDRSGATFDDYASGVSSEDGKVGDGNNGNDGRSGSRNTPDEERRGILYRCGLGVCGRKLLFNPILSHKNTTPPHPRLVPLGGRSSHKQIP